MIVSNRRPCRARATCTEELPLLLPRLSFLLALSLTLVHAYGASAKASPEKTPESETQHVISAFRAAAARSISARSGDIFALPTKYHYVVSRANLRYETSSIPSTTGSEPLRHMGNHHGTFWGYDTHIPLIFWGPGRIHGALRSDEAATQQDIVPTLAHLLGAVPPEDAAGRVLHPALMMPPQRPPRVVLMLVFDQGGQSLLSAHPDAWPFIRQLREEGTSFEKAQVTHLDPETVVGHVALGTGAYPRDHGVMANKPYNRALGIRRAAVAGPDGPWPLGIESPSLADVWLAQTGGKAVVISQSLADRAAIGMVGHGAFYGKNPKPICHWLDDHSGRWVTQHRAFRQPSYVENLQAPTRWPRTGMWHGRIFTSFKDFKTSPGTPEFDGETMRLLLKREAIGQDDVTDLIFWSMKATDYVAHRYGLESLEARDALRAVDNEARRTVQQLTQRVGRENLVIVFTADHGGAPLVERYGGKRLSDEDVVNWINQRFDNNNNGVPLARAASSTQIWLDDGELKNLKLAKTDIRDAIKQWKPTGKPFYAAVFTREEIEKPNPSPVPKAK